MANLYATPNQSGVDAQNNIKVPVNYSQESGLGLFLSQLNVTHTVPVVRTVTAAQFISGSYSMPLPNGYTPEPYKLPMIEPRNVIVNGDTVVSYLPVNVYIVGSSSDLVNVASKKIPIKFNNQSISIGGKTFTAMVEDSEYYVIMNITQGSTIDWDNSDFIGKDKYTDQYLQSESIWMIKFDVIGGRVQLIDINNNNFYRNGIKNLKTTKKDFLVNVINEIYDMAKAGALGPAGGDLAGTYPNPTIKAGAVVSDRIADEAVTRGKIARLAIGVNELDTGAVTTEKIANGAVTNGKLATNSVSTGKIVNGSVDSDKLADGSVSTGKIVNGAVTSLKIASKAVVTGNIGDAAVTVDKLASASVTTPKIASGSVTLDKLLGPIRKGNEYRFVVAYVDITNKKITPSESGVLGSAVWGGDGTMYIAIQGTDPNKIINVMAGVTAIKGTSVAWGVFAKKQSSVIFIGYSNCSEYTLLLQISNS